MIPRCEGLKSPTALKLVHSHSRVDNLLQVTKLYALLVAFHDEAEALRSFGAA